MEYKLVQFDAEKCGDFEPNEKFNTCKFYDPASDSRECGFCKLSKKYYRCLADVRRGIPLSFSSINNFLTCHYYYYLKNIRGIEQRPSMISLPLKRGTLWDAVKQKHLGGIDKETGKPYDIAALIDKYEIPSREVAAIRALYRAYKILDMTVDEGYSLQAKVDLVFDIGKKWGESLFPVTIDGTGYYDRKYPTYFCEDKMTTRVDNYLDPLFIQSQVALYFLADPKLDYCIMEVVRFPELKSTGSHKDESDQTYGERVYEDIISRPSHYFIGYDSTKNMYGKKYFRKEFALDEVRDRFIHVFREYYEARMFDGWYKNDRVCKQVLPGIPCDMLDLCRIHNKFNETVYKIRDRIMQF